MTGATRYECPVDDCLWTLTVPPPGPFEYGENSVSVRMVAPATVEAALRAHVDSHTPEQYLRTIMRLRGRVAELESNHTIV